MHDNTATRPRADNCTATNAAQDFGGDAVFPRTIATDFNNRTRAIAGSRKWLCSNDLRTQMKVENTAAASLWPQKHDGARQKVSRH
jgi:hypothetical protein